jgi:hypothetical protein
MSFEEVTCFVPVCDDCGPFCWDGCEDGPPHFVGATAAAAQVLADNHGWTIEYIAGAVRMLCPRCARRRHCDQNSHQWYAPTLDAPAAGRPVELCSRCGIVRRDYEPLDVPPAGHPDLKPVALTAEHLAVLDAYEAEFTEARKER